MKLPVTDYHDFSHINTTAEKRKRLAIGDLYINGAECKICDWFVRSKNRHHMISCKCGAVAVDGGSWYSKISGSPENYTAITIPFTKI
jgi:hypothetical protein